LPDSENAEGGQTVLKENHLLTRRRACATPILPDSDFQNLALTRRARLYTVKKEGMSPNGDESLTGL